MNISLINNNFTRTVTVIFLITGFCVLILPAAGIAESEKEKSDVHSIDVDKLAKNIFVSCELFYEGKKLYDNRDYDNARLKFREALALDLGNLKASKYLKLCGPNKKTGSENKPPVIAAPPNEIILEEKRNENDIQLLQSLIERLDKVEDSRIIQTTLSQSQKTASSEKKQESSKKASTRFKERVRSIKPNQYSAEKKKLESTSLEEIEKAENLLSKGDKYYENLNYEKAYQLYKSALEILHTKPDSSL